jgi:hypothetical protein
MLTRDQILGAPEPELKPIPVPEWGGEVYIKVMSGTERDRWEILAFTDGKVNRDNFRATLLVKTLCDDKGNPIFTDVDVAALSAKPSPALVRLAKTAMKVNALTDSDVDELTKN